MDEYKKELKEAIRKAEDEFKEDEKEEFKKILNDLEIVYKGESYQLRIEEVKVMELDINVKEMLEEHLANLVLEVSGVKFKLKSVELERIGEMTKDET